MKAINTDSQLSDAERGAIRIVLTNIALWGTSIAAASAGGVIKRVAPMTIGPIILRNLAEGRAAIIAVVAQRI